MLRRFYFNTSVFGGVFDIEFERETALLFEKVGLGQIKCVYSNLKERELINAPERVRHFFADIDEFCKKKLMVTRDALQLAQKYIEEKVVGETSLDDCIHIALATLSQVDMLVSCNFKHIVNVQRIHGYNSVNSRLGYKTLEIYSQKQILENESRY